MSKRILLALLAIMAGNVEARAAEPVHRMYVFGDSYSDMGRGYLDGNGPTAVAYLAQRLGLDMVVPEAQSVRDKSLNFAVSGAPTGESKSQPVPGGYLGLGMVNQVRDFETMVRAGRIHFDPKTTLFFLAGGLNDGKIATAQAVANLKSEISTLYALGARRFEVAILPVEIPAFSKTALRLNPALAAIPAAMRPSLLGARIETSHWGAFFDEVMLHPASYGITDTTNACAGRLIFNEDPTPCSRPSAHFYYHQGHPSTVVHKAVGDKLYEELRRR